jgi:hypothetical protein
MKINRTDGPPIIIGKRVTVGGIIGGMVAVLTWVWNITYPDNQISAPIALSVTASITGLVQVWLVQRYGITTP